jgi:RNA polymerase sigma-70 factor (ECF subfamily)
VYVATVQATFAVSGLNEGEVAHVSPNVSEPALEDMREAYNAHGGELYGFAVRSLNDAGLAEEAVQETFVRAWRAAERFDPEIGSLRTWLFAIMRNIVIDLSRMRAARPTVGGDVPDIGHEPLEEMLLSWQVEEALRRIGEHHRQALIETYFRDRSYAEVGAELGVPEGTVKSRVYYGLRALRNSLEEMGYDG